MRIEWNRRNILIALAVVAGVILIVSGLTEALLLGLFGGAGLSLRKLTKQRKRTDKGVDEIKKTIESAKEFSENANKEVENIYEKIGDADIDTLISLANERERLRNTTIR